MSSLILLQLVSAREREVRLLGLLGRALRLGGSPRVARSAGGGAAAPVRASPNLPLRSQQPRSALQR